MRVSRFSVLLIAAFILSLFVWGSDSQAANQSHHGWSKADYVLVEKAKRRMTLYRNGRVLRSYQVSLGKGGLAPKEREGDMKTPEGMYYIDGRNPDSKYHLSLHISYPSPKDIRRARAKGVSPGSHITIHGVGSKVGWFENVAYKFRDWTLGCVAVTNREIEEIWYLVPDATPVEIRR